MVRFFLLRCFCTYVKWKQNSKVRACFISMTRAKIRTHCWHYRGHSVAVVRHFRTKSGASTSTLTQLQQWHRSRTDSCLGRNVINSKPVTSGVPRGYCPWPATVSDIYIYIYIYIYIHQWPAELCEFINHQTVCWWLSDLQRDPLSARNRRPRCIADLDALQTWARRWLVRFHPQKCQLLRITRKPSPIIAQYNSHGHVLEVADTAKYLGVTLHKHCAWSKHISQTAKMANNTRAFLQRNIRRAQTSVKKRPTRLSLGLFWSALGPTRWIRHLQAGDGATPVC